MRRTCARISDGGVIPGTDETRGSAIRSSAVPPQLRGGSRVSYAPGRCSHNACSPMLAVPSPIPASATAAQRRSSRRRAAAAAATATTAPHGRNRPSSVAGSAPARMPGKSAPGAVRRQRIRRNGTCIIGLTELFSDLYPFQWKTLNPRREPVPHLFKFSLSYVYNVDENSAICNHFDLIFRNSGV